MQNERLARSVGEKEDEASGLSVCVSNCSFPTHPYFEHTKYELAISSHARKKWGVKITGDFRTPCSLVHQVVVLHLEALHVDLNITLKSCILMLAFILPFLGVAIPPL